MAEHTDFGKQAEQCAVEYLESKGYRIVAKNFRYQKAEIDIIAEYENLLIIIEVKARANNLFIEPYEAVDKRKIKLIVSAADAFLRENPYENEVRFDIVSIIRGEGNQLKIQHIENAFESFDAN
ncbi:YraN family protein [Bergeyella porcorum]|uniref:YraN family protein n=1 Tax=Bergeyella porcorum TaxID=1735111 RepID=UPI0035EEB0BA